MSVYPLNFPANEGNFFILPFLYYRDAGDSHTTKDIIIWDPYGIASFKLHVLNFKAILSALHRHRKC